MNRGHATFYCQLLLSRVTDSFHASRKFPWLPTISVSDSKNRHYLLKKGWALVNSKELREIDIWKNLFSIIIVFLDNCVTGFSVMWDVLGYGHEEQLKGASEEQRKTSLPFFIISLFLFD